MMFQRKARFFFSVALPFFTVFLSTAQQVKRANRPDWITPQEFKKDAKPESGDETGSYYLLLDEQEHVGKQEQFSHYAYSILNAEGVQQMADLSVTYDPSYESIYWHQITLHRNGQKIDQMPFSFNIIQRETSADRYLYDGSKTVVVNLSDIRVGDIVEYSYTRKGYNPVYNGNFSRNYSLAYTTSFERSYTSLQVPNHYQLQWKYDNTNISVNRKVMGDNTLYSWQVERPRPVVYYSNEPEWYDIAPRIYCSSYKSWQEVVAWAQPLFAWDERDLAVLKSQADIYLGSKNTEEYITKSIEFVQDEIRYLGFENGINSHKPHAPSKVLTQRFGDCKDKSLLLVALLQLKKIKAFPLLVNTRLRKEVANRLPSHAVFDHCIVWYEYNGEIKVVDPTLNNQGGNWQYRYCPDYGAGLVVSPTHSSIITLPITKGGTITESQEIKISSIGGSALLSVVSEYTGSEADYLRSYLSNNSRETIQNNYQTFYGNLYPDIKRVNDITWNDNRDENLISIHEEYNVTEFWRQHQTKEGVVFCEFYPQSLETHFNVQKTNSRDAPYRLAHPLELKHTIRVLMPESWPIENSDVTIANDYYQYSYSIDYDDKALTLNTAYKTLQSEVPATFIKTFTEDHSKMMSNLSYTLSYDKTIQATLDNPIYGILLTIFSLGLGAWIALKLYKGYDPQPQESKRWERPIGGWLILIGLGLCITPVRLLFQFFTEDYLWNGTSWVSNYLTGNYFVATFIMLEQVYNMVYLIFTLLLIALFFQKRTSLPRLVSIWLVVGAMVTTFDTLFAYSLAPNTDLDLRDMFRSILSACIWVPYFAYSDRVKETFINTLRPTELVEPENT